MAGSTVERTVSTTSGQHDIGYPHGHLGHLSADQERALQEFKVFLEKEKLYTAGAQPSHDDQTLLRFLRARRWVVQDAYKQFKDTEDWRKASQLEVLYDTIDVDAYEETRSLYPQWTGRRDKRGIPLYLFQIRHLESKTVATYEKKCETTPASLAKPSADGSTPEKMLRLFALYENLTRFAQPLCTEMPDRDHADTPITLSTNIVDVSQVSLRMFWNLKSHMQSASTLATAHYPETLDRIFIIGAPYFFSTVWGWIKRWFDPITVSKIFILSPAEAKAELERFIDPRNIPKAYGGELDFEFFDRPNLDPEIKKHVTWEKGVSDFPKGPLYWRKIDGEERLECLAVGRVGGQPRRERVCTIPVAFPKVAAAADAVPVAAHVDVKVDAAVEAVQSLNISEDKGAPAAEISEKVAAVTTGAAAAAQDKPPATVQA